MENIKHGQIKLNLDKFECDESKYGAKLRVSKHI